MVFVLFYLRFLSSTAAAATTAMITTAAPMISNVSVERGELGCGATVGDPLAEAVVVGCVVGVGVEMLVGAGEEALVTSKEVSPSLL